MTAAERAETGRPIRLSDGRSVVLRTIGPSDAAALRAFHDGLSERTVYQRFFAPHPHLSDRDVDYFTRVDHRAREALVAVAGDPADQRTGDGGSREEIVGVGRFDVIDGSAAEVAFVVTDACQGQGIATELLRQLIERAGRRGIQRFVAETLPGNAAMLRVFERCGLGYQTRHGDGVVTVELNLGGAAPGTSSEESR